MKYVVTGGAGFIGSNLADELIARGHEVRVIDNLSTGLRDNLNPQAEFFELDIRNLEAIKPVFVGIDGIFHLAALPRIQRSIENPKETHEVNVVGTLNVLLSARDAGAKRIVYSASASAYGNQSQLPVREDFKTAPLNPYGLQKWMGEEYCKLFNSLYGLETVSLRYFNVYGPKMLLGGDYATVIGIFIRQKKNEEPLTIIGDGEQTRDFTHVRDVVKANILAMESSHVGKGEIINVGRGNPVSVNEIARLIGGRTLNLLSRPGEIRRSQADVSRAKEFLGWQPTVKFSDGLKELLRIHGLL